MSITSANAILTILIETIFPTPIQLQGFSGEDIYTSGPLASVETSMGLDGNLAAGFVFVPVPWNVSLMADSASNDVFDQWYDAQQGAKEVYAASGSLILPGIGKKWALTRGFLSSFPPFPDAAKTLRARRYGMMWQSVSAAQLI